MLHTVIGYRAEEILYQIKSTRNGNNSLPALISMQIHTFIGHTIIQAF